MSMSNNIGKSHRRSFLGGLFLFGAGVASSNVSAARPGSDRNAESRIRRDLRFAHITDVHLDHTKNSPKGLAAALRHIEMQKDRPDLIVSGGDQIWDALAVDEQTADAQFALWKKIVAEECSLPIKYCIGNHEIWGWDKEKSKTTGNEEFWGKKKPVREFSMPGRYYAFDEGSWRIIILDSFVQDNSVYAVRLDDEQFAWLEEQLEASSGMHICIISHAPIFSAVATLRGRIESPSRWVLRDELVHFDAKKIMGLFRKHENVQLCISGHSHRVERIEYNNVTYISDGAVCGRWWKGENAGTEEGYGIFDLYADGTFDHQYVDYEWTVK